MDITNRLGCIFLNGSRTSQKKAPGFLQPRAFRKEFEANTASG